MCRMFLFFVLLAVAFAGGCVSAPRSAPPRGAPPARMPVRVAPSPGRAPAPDSISAQVVTIARSLLATPYHYAGSDPKGFDCSGLTAFVYEKVGLTLPRTAQAQASAGRWVAPDELSSGDLVFFGESRAKPYHVGVVVSEPGEPLTMIHASSSRGVVETAVLTNSYWLRRLRFGRRVLERTEVE